MPRRQEGALLCAVGAELPRGRGGVRAEHASRRGGSLPHGGGLRTSLASDAARRAPAPVRRAGAAAYGGAPVLALLPLRPLGAAHAGGGPPFTSPQGTGGGGAPGSPPTTPPSCAPP